MMTNKTIPIVLTVSLAHHLLESEAFPYSDFVLTTEFACTSWLFQLNLVFGKFFLCLFQSDSWLSLVQFDVQFLMNVDVLVQVPMHSWNPYAWANWGLEAYHSSCQGKRGGLLLPNMARGALVNSRSVHFSAAHMKCPPHLADLQVWHYTRCPFGNYL